MNVSAHGRVFGAVALGSLLATALVSAPVLINNASFETPALALGGLGFGPAAGWTAVGVNGYWYPNGTAIIAAAPDGHQFAYVNGGGSVTQSLGVALQPFTTYTLSIRVTGRSDGYNPGTAYFAALVVGTTRIMAVTPVAPRYGQWTTVTGTYTTGESVPSGSVSVQVGCTSSSLQLDFDLVQLDATPLAIAPTITAQPQSQSVLVGTTVSLSVTASGSPAPSYQWRKNGAAIAGATASTLNLGAVALGDAGTYSVLVSNGSGSAVSNNAVLTVGVPAAASILSQPSTQTTTVGGNASFTVSAAGIPGPAYQWQASFDGGTTWTALANGGNYAGAGTATLTVSNVRLPMAGNQYRVSVSNASGPAAVSSPATLLIAASRLVNVSVRGSAGTGDQTLIVGFVTTGLGQKAVLTRAVGPSLAQFGVGNLLADPQLSLFNTAGAPINQNNDWGGGAGLTNAFAQVGAFPLPGNSRDAALLVNVLSGTNTAQVSGVGGTTGVVLAETYDLDDSTPTARIVNLSVRNQVGTGDSILIVGFVISGGNPVTMLIRGIGPGLTQFGVGGVLANPRLQLFSGSTLVGDNDNWGGLAQLSTAAASVGAFALPANSLDSALLVNLQPGGYTAQVIGVGNTTGVALVELYELPP